MWHRFVLLAIGFVSGSFGADDGWAKVKALASGTELRIGKVGTRAPILAKMDQATDESLIIATKTEQISIAKEQIEKIEYRPAQTGSRVTRETKTDNVPLAKDAARPTPGPARTPGPSGSSSSGVTISGKAEFQLIWARGRRN
ncbi:MAG: hypothetical protein ACKV2U_21110 [Bryobacteraceae bacterium]